MKLPTILIAGERGRLRKRIYQWFANAETSPVVVEDSRQISTIIDQVRPAIALCISANSSTQKGLKWLTKIRTTDTTMPVILIAEKSSESLAIAALRAGATDYLKTPIQRGELLSRCRQIISSRVPLGANTTKGNY